MTDIRQLSGADMPAGENFFQPAATNVRAPPRSEILGTPKNGCAPRAPVLLSP